MQSHSIFHLSEKAKCNKAWAELRGSDIVRTCPACDAVVYNFNDLTQEQAAQLVREHEELTGDIPRLHRRDDGTFTTSLRPCTFIGLPASYYVDYRNSLKLSGSIIARFWYVAVPYWLLIVVPPLVPDWKLLLTIVTFPFATILLAILQIQIVNASMQSLGGPAPKLPLSFSLTQLWLVWLVNIAYWLGIAAGVLMAIFPAFVNAVRGCLALPIVVTEELGPLKAIDRSWHLTDVDRENQFFVQGWRYLFIPSLVSILLLSVPFDVSAIHSPDVGWQLLLCLLVPIMSVLPMARLIADSAFIPMQVNLYLKLKQPGRQIESSPTVEQ